MLLIPCVFSVSSGGLGQSMRATSLPGVSLEGRLEEAELATSGIKEAMVFGCVSDGSRMMLTFSVFAVLW